jgi:Mrp family chromosome partitioning ATPase
MRRAVADYIVVDAPPLCPVQDCQVIAHWVDGFLLVVAAGNSPPARREALNVVERSKVLGFIFSGDDQPASAHSGYYGYHGYYGGNGAANGASLNGHGRLGRTVTRVGQMLQRRRGGGR